ncbi:MAG: hypothetical protein AAFX75_14605 [Pseudomonadota bacterium]
MNEMTKHIQEAMRLKETAAIQGLEISTETAVQAVLLQNLTAKLGAIEELTSTMERISRDWHDWTPLTDALNSVAQQVDELGTEIFKYRGENN